MIQDLWVLVELMGNQVPLAPLVTQGHQGPQGQWVFRVHWENKGVRAAMDLPVPLDIQEILVSKDLEDHLGSLACMALMDWWVKKERKVLQEEMIQAHLDRQGCLVVGGILGTMDPREPLCRVPKGRRDQLDIQAAQVLQGHLVLPVHKECRMLDHLVTWAPQGLMDCQVQRESQVLLVQ